MNKDTWEAIKSLIDSFIKREELLRELLDDKEKELKKNEEFFKKLNE